jgi:hypothetical protein
MKEILARICALQPQYSSSKTPAMQERGQLIRTDLLRAFKARLPSLQGAFGPDFGDLDAEASDGIGRKTEAPWVRVFSRAMSPNPREGFYFVVHFAADGTAVFLTVGCGSTVLSGGDLRSLPDEELARRTDWARTVILERWGSLEPYSDAISLGAKADLPRTFEKATAVAKRIPVSELEDAALDDLIFGAMQRLAEVYEAQRSQRDVSPAMQDMEAIEAIARPLSSRRQGMGLSAPERRAVERRAMDLAMDHLMSLGFNCKDTSANKPYDLLVTKEGLELKVEVKGTTSDGCDAILMTRNEVDLHRREKGATGLILASKIRLKREDGAVSAVGGKVEILLGWDIDQWVANPVTYLIARG